MRKVCLDTSFLISFADPTRPHHTVALDYYRYCVSEGILMYLSVVAAGEFEVRQPITDLPLSEYIMLPYNLPDAVRAARLRAKLIEKSNAFDSGDTRRIIVNDLMIIAQAEEEAIPIILSEDASTLSRFAAHLRSLGDAAVDVILLADGFTPGRLSDPDQTELGLAAT
jgi:predicted nucleic acid-binding protein